MNGSSRVERLGTENIGKLLLEMSSQTTLALLVYAIYSVTDTYFLSVGINSLAAAGASIISPVLLALGGVATTVGAGGASVVSRALGEANTEKASRTVANTFLIFWIVAIALTVFGALFIRPIVSMLGATESDWSTMAEVLIIGFPSFVKSISASMVVIVTNNLLKLIGGDSALGVFAIVNRLYSGLNTPQTGIMQGMQPILGYNFGQKRFGRVRKTLTYSLGTVAVYGLIVCSLCLLIPATLIALLSKEPVMIAEGQVALRLMSLACPLSGISVMVAAYFQAVGRAKEAVLITLGGIILVKMPVLLLASSLFSLTGIWAAGAVSECILCIISLLMLRRYQEKLVTMEHLASRP
jgi:Na+-driven multidrug efflux pump